MTALLAMWQCSFRLGEADKDGDEDGAGDDCDYDVEGVDGYVCCLQLPRRMLRYCC